MVAAELSLKDYLETRLNLLTEKMKEAEVLQHEALNALAESARAAALAADLRYQQRFEAQSDALTAALQAAKEAVQAAQAAADRAVAKAEAAADKRFEALNELRQMLNDIVGTMLTRNEAKQQFDAVTEKIGAAEAHIARVESRLDTQQGAEAGGRQTKLDTKSLVALVISILMAAVAIISFILARRG